MRALVKKAGQEDLQVMEISEITEITGNNHSANMVTLYNGKDGKIILWVNDCALLEQLPFNFYLDGLSGRTSIIAGDVVFSSFGRVGPDYDAIDITDEQIKRVKNAMCYQHFVMELLQ